MDGTTRVGGRRVAVRRMNRPALWYFSSGARGRKEAGVYAFWTAVLNAKARKGLCGRALVALAPGDRFDRVRHEMRHGPKDDRPAYRMLWQKVLRGGRAIRYIRPSSAREVARWMRSHADDAKFARPVKLPR